MGPAFILAYGHRDSAMPVTGSVADRNLSGCSHKHMKSSSHFSYRGKSHLAHSARSIQWMRRMSLLRGMLAPFAALLMFASTLPVASAQTHNESAHPLELSRPVRPWEFLPLVGTRAALFGDESGSMEAWVYPLKFLREFRLQFHEAGRVVPAEALARMIIVRPESSTIVYSSDTFTVRETFFVPVKEPGAIILLNVETEQPLEIEA